MDLNLEVPSALIPTRREQLRELEASIAVVDERISLSEAQVRALLFALEALKGERSELHDKKSALILAPSRQLPNELLSNIFQSAMDQTRFMDEQDRETLTNIRRVCKHWDSVARKTPGLWRNLYIGIEKRWRSTDVLALKVHNWLLLGGVGAPLRLSLRCEVHPYSEPAEWTFLTVLTQPWNWTEIHLNLGISCLLALLWDIAEEDFKPWRTLKLLALDISFATDIDVELGDQALPNLDHLHLSFSRLEWLSQLDPAFVTSIRIMHPSVTTLCLSRTTVSNHKWLSVLFNAENFPTLKKLILQDLVFTHGAVENPPTSPPRVLPVEWLIVQGRYSLWALDYLTLPAVKFLQLVNTPGHNPFSSLLDPIRNFVARSQPKLETLSLDQSNLCEGDQGDVISFFKVCRTLHVTSLNSFKWALWHKEDDPIFETVVCSKPALENQQEGVRVDIHHEFIRHLRARSRTPGAPSLTIVSPDTRIATQQYWGKDRWQEITSLVQGGWVKFLQTVDDLDPKEVTILKPYKTEGPFAVAALDD
ncbi:hypothetical protein BKA70DRAFT_1437605 [Coprinopsis sp. MPI-PUGE-AT-0042]|nr:hypothetical protein BKA70DRAFT_1437605 [Coprinopsis sp. MPI-PUGE-AT-0042]